jgi:hypothetical protein
MEQKHISDITSLTVAVNRLLEFVQPSTPRPCATAIHTTVRNVLFEVNQIIDDATTSRLAAALAPKEPPANTEVTVVCNPQPLLPPGAVVLTADLVQQANIGLLGLPMRLEIPLQKAGMRKIRDLCAASLDFLRDIDGVGSSGLDTIMEALEVFDVTLTE